MTKAFGAAVTHLVRKFEDFDILKQRADIKEYIKEHPEDERTAIAWKLYLNGIKNTSKVEKAYYMWYATDVFSKEKFEGKTCKELGDKIGASQSMVNFAYNNARLLNKRFEITRKEVPKGTRGQLYTWLATDKIKGQVITAGSAKKLACKLHVAESTIVNYRISGQPVFGKYTITRKKAQ